MLTLSVHGEVEVADVAELSKDLVEVLLGDVLRQPLDDNLGNTALASAPEKKRKSKKGKIISAPRTYLCAPSRRQAPAPAPTPTVPPIAPTPTPAQAPTVRPATSPVPPIPSRSRRARERPGPRARPRPRHRPRVAARGRRPGSGSGVAHGRRAAGGHSFCSGAASKPVL